MIRWILGSILLATQVFAADYGPEVLIAEFDKLYAYVQTIEPDGVIGHRLNYKKLETHTIYWDLARNDRDYDALRLQNNHDDGTANFQVSYFRSYDLVEGQRVIRRFVGPLISGWRADTIDLDTGDYYGWQGTKIPIVSDSDRSVLAEWGIQLLR